MSVPERGYPARRQTTDLIEIASQTEQIRALGETLIASGLLPDAIRKPEAAVAVMLKGRECGMPPMYALSHIAIIKGKPTMTAEAMLGLVQAAGHIIRIVETSSERCIIEGIRANDKAHKSRIEWTMEDARRAGLDRGNGPWKTYPRAMLRSRAVSELCRAMFADVLSGVSFVPEELGAEVNEEGEIIVEAAPIAALPRREKAESKDELLIEIGDMLRQIPEDVRPDGEKVRAYASESLTNARRTLAKLKKDAESGWGSPVTGREDAEVTPEQSEMGDEYEDAEVVENFPADDEDFDFGDIDERSDG